MSTLGSPSLATLRTNDVKSIQAVFNQVTQRLAAIEQALGLVPGGTSLLTSLTTQADGLVVKYSGQLVTRRLAVGDELTVDNPTGALGDPKITVPFIADVLDQPDGFVVKTGTDAVTRVLIGGSGSGITIHDNDGVAGDPDFTVP